MTMIARITSLKFFWTISSPPNHQPAEQEQEHPGDAAGDVVDGERR